MNFRQLETVHEKAVKAGVNYSMHYCQADDSYYFEVSSTAPDEDWTARNRSFGLAVESVCEWLDSLISEVK